MFKRSEVMLKNILGNALETISQYFSCLEIAEDPDPYYATVYRSEPLPLRSALDEDECVFQALKSLVDTDYLIHLFNEHNEKKLHHCDFSQQCGLKLQSWLISNEKVLNESVSSLNGESPAVILLNYKGEMEGVSLLYSSSHLPEL